MKKTILVVSFLRFYSLIVALVTLGCAEIGQAATVRVTLANFSFSPASITISAGDAVIFHNSGGFHNALCQNTEPNCGTFPNASSANWSFTNQFNLPGTYHYRCSIHSVDFNAGMIGLVVVKPSAPLLVTPALGGDGRFHFSVNGPANVDQIVEVTTNLTHWSPILTNQSPDGHFDFSGPTDSVIQFYRVRD